MIIYENKTITKEKKIATACKCNRCGAIILQGQYYYQVYTSHSEWGRDSCDSLESKQLCLNGCLGEEFGEYAKNNRQSKKIEVERLKLELSHF